MSSSSQDHSKKPPAGITSIDEIESLPSSSAGQSRAPSKGILKLWSPTPWRNEDSSRKNHIELQSSPKGGSVTITSCASDSPEPASSLRLPQSNLSSSSNARHDNDSHGCSRASKHHLSSMLKDATTRRSYWTHVRKVRDWIIQHKPYVPDPQGRVLHIKPREKVTYLERISQKPYVDNHVTSSRYTVYNFLPLQLVFQFSKVANIYFLTVSILQMIPGLSTTGTYTTIIPLSIFVAIAIAREGYDDLRRHRMDKVENRTEVNRVQISKDGTFMERRLTTWQSLKVGDLVTLSQDEWIPADILLLQSHHDDGRAYVETAALDGETNLKTKRAHSITAERCTENNFVDFDALIESEAPNKDLYNYQGSITCGERRVPLTNDQIIYRGSILRNTAKIIAVVLFTGEESKIRLNASAPVRAKRPSMQALVNKVVIAVAAFVICLAIFCTCGYYVWHSDIETKLWYLDVATQISFFPIFVSFLILFNTMVPLSLYVSMEIVKLIQQLLLQQDIDLYHNETDTPAEARTATINEELGQVSHIFTDKTGTLTDNEMIFRRISIAGHAWIHESHKELDHNDQQPFLRQKLRKEHFSLGRRSTTALEGSYARSNSDHIRQHSIGHARKSSIGHRRPSRNSIHGHTKVASISWKKSVSHHEQDPITSRYTSDLLSYMKRHPHTVFARRARFFLLSIALCHTALPNQLAKEGADRTFSAASPDELALVVAAMELGYLMINRDAKTVTLRITSSESDDLFSEEVYTVHHVIEFSSVRKRMSIIFSFPDGRLCLVCKGADSMVSERLRYKDLARKKFQEVSQAANLRRSVEAGQAMARKSMARPSISRPSMSGRARIDSMRELDRFFEAQRQETPQTELDVGEKAQSHIMRHSIAFGESFTSRGVQDSVVDEAIATNESAIFQRTFQHLESFATEGLRVLMYGHRFLSAEEHSAWEQKFHDASVSLINRQDSIERVAELIEVDLELTGVTAIEDKLQDGVPASIDKLHRAGIKLWMLTGDKRETAINIGLSTGLIKDFSTIIVLDHEEPSLQEIIVNRSEDIANERLAHSVVVVDGLTLQKIEHDTLLLPLFIKLAVNADTSICCRASPSQKAGLVHQVRKTIPSAVTLAIGDGANDIAMIKEAHIGIGITGKEGLQAARSSDYSIAQFRFLVKLLLVHGRWNYMRICKYVLGTFYKEILLFLTQAIYQKYAGYTGTSLHESWSLSLFNTLFSSLAVICLGAFEKDLSASTLLAVPELYETSRTGQAFSIRIFLGWMSLAATQSVLCFYVAYFAFAQPVAGSLFPFGDMVFTTIVLVINVKLIFLEMHAWSILNYIFFGISFVGWWAWQVLQSALYKDTLIYFVRDAFLEQFGRETLWWASITLVILSLLLVDIVFQVTRSNFMPTEEDKFRELQSDKVLKARLEEEAAQELQAGWIEDLLARRGVAESE